MSVETLALVILLFPVVGALLLAGRGWRWPRLLTKLVGPGVVWASFGCTLAILFQNPGPVDHTYWTWIQSGSFNLPANLVIDHLSLFMSLVITGVGGLIVTYAVGYMSHENDASYARFFAYMDVFVFSMLLLVLAGNFVFLLIGWAMVGVSSYFLIGFYYWKPSAVVAARKAFVMNVIGDIGMILAVFAIFFSYHSTTYAGMFAAVPKGDEPALELIAFLLLVGGIAKSAQLPLHTWLPDAMEGPTPVSALIHAATMVTAGVYLVARMHPIYEVAVYAHNTVAIIGALSALFAASIAIVQTDIKRVLAYSTMSQIGYMFMAVGVGAYAIALFHLVSHAFFKALLFMSAGNVIHSMDDEQDMRRFGGLWRQLRPTSISFLIGSLALVGVIPFVGFFSKELILGTAFSKPDNPVSIAVWAVGVVTAILTGFYTGRMWWIAFWGPPSPTRPVAHPHEAPPVMLIPVVILACLASVGGLLQLNAVRIPFSPVTDFLEPVVGKPSWEGGNGELVATFLTVVLSTLAFFWAYLFYVRRSWAPWSSRFPRLQTLLEHKYYFDEMYNALFVRPTDRLAGGTDRYLDRPLIGGAVNAVGNIAEATAGGLSLTQNGYFRSYALVFLGGALIAGLIVLYRSTL